MGAQTVYFTKETLELIERMREINPQFNLAGFIRKSIEWEMTGRSDTEEETILNRLKELDLQEEAIQKQKEIWQQRLIEFKDRMKLMALKKEQERMEKEEHENNKVYSAMRLKAWKDYMESDDNLTVYKEGLKAGKWDSTGEFYEKYLKEQKQ